MPISVVNQLLNFDTTAGYSPAWIPLISPPAKAGGYSSVNIGIDIAQGTFNYISNGADFSVNDLDPITVVEVNIPELMGPNDAFPICKLLPWGDGGTGHIGLHLVNMRLNLNYNGLTAVKYRVVDQSSIESSYFFHVDCLLNLTASFTGKKRDLVVPNVTGGKLSYDVANNSFITTRQISILGQ